MANKHHLTNSPNETLTAFYLSDAQHVVIYAHSAPMWRFVLESNGGIPELREVLESHPNLTVSDVLWLMDTMNNIDTWVEICPQDLSRYGQVGISF